MRSNVKKICTIQEIKTILNLDLNSLTNRKDYYTAIVRDGIFTHYQQASRLVTQTQTCQEYS